MSLARGPEVVKRLLAEEAAQLLGEQARAETVDGVVKAALGVLRRKGAVRIFGGLVLEGKSLVACTGKGRFPIPLPPSHACP